MLKQRRGRPKTLEIALVPEAAPIADLRNESLTTVSVELRMDDYVEIVSVASA